MNSILAANTSSGPARQPQHPTGMIRRARGASRSSEYRNLRHVVPSLRRQRDVDKVELVTEAARYIDHLHKTLIERFVVCGIPSSLKDVLGTDDASELGSQHIMNLVASMAAAQRQEEQRQQLAREQQSRRQNLSKPREHPHPHPQVHPNGSRSSSNNQYLSHLANARHLNRRKQQSRRTVAAAATGHSSRCRLGPGRIAQISARQARKICSPRRLHLGKRSGHFSPTLRLACHKRPAE